ncbi:winged helix-turn-helix domain-containing protein [Pseudothauera rhizosphaerae]|uniref:Response regulator n=1 Tax=Pseudothauera rhizosphaerae TaxID=2565932 RepID=A0A4S4AZL0_9RHOO|nr:winged helix-turn-helix domain-containing protein [Pseudothauera rhizosphaerae]THF65199.1 response regulator [Pseudothauera rhizosphaerae]
MTLPAQPDAALIYIAEDEPKMAALLIDYLHAGGHATQWIADGREVVPAVRARPPHLLLLDLMLPGRDGMDICHELRGFSEVPIIMLTARVEEVDRLAGLDAGADDYICKTPFSPREVVARVNALLRRSRRKPAPDGGAAPFVIDDAGHRATLNGVALDLTPVEFRLLRAFSNAPGRVFSRDSLLNHVHDDQRAVTDRAVDSHVKNLRRKLDAVTPGREWIHSVYGVGYRFEA